MQAPAVATCVVSCHYLRASKSKCTRSRQFFDDSPKSCLFPAKCTLKNPSALAAKRLHLDLNPTNERLPCVMRKKRVRRAHLNAVRPQNSCDRYRAKLHLRKISC